MRGADDDPTLRAAVPQKHLHQAVRQLDSSGRYVGAQEGIRGHAERTKAAQFLERPASCTRFRTDSKLDVAGSTPVARSLSVIVSARSRSDGGIAGAHDTGLGAATEKSRHSPGTPFRAWVPLSTNCNP